MVLSAIDRIIAREVGFTCWVGLQKLYPGIEELEEYQAYGALFEYLEPYELLAVRLEDPFVEYPVIYLGIDLFEGRAPAPFLYPPSHGQALRLSEYLAALRTFLMLQFISESESQEAHIPLIMNAVLTLARDVSKDELLRFADQLWRGRWIVGARSWSDLRRVIIAGGSEEGIRELENNVERLEAEALRLIQMERKLKDDAQSLEEWLHEAYCLLPDIHTWGVSIGRANRRYQSDELEKFDRVLDEFQADIWTTIRMVALDKRHLAYLYAYSPLVEKQSFDEAVKNIRGIYRGRSIIPRVWYETAKKAIERLKSTNVDLSQVSRLDKPQSALSLFSPVDCAALSDIDLMQSFGRIMTMDSRESKLVLPFSKLFNMNE